MERHKTTQSHANGTTMGRFPRLTPVRLSPQVPDHMTVSPKKSHHFTTLKVQSLDTPKTSAIQLVAKVICARHTLRPLDLNNVPSSGENPTSPAEAAEPAIPGGF